MPNSIRLLPAPITLKGCDRTLDHGYLQLAPLMRQSWQSIMVHWLELGLLANSTVIASFTMTITGNNALIALVVSVCSTACVYFLVEVSQDNKHIIQN